MDLPHPRPKTRNDRGQLRAIDDATASLIERLKRENPHRTGTALLQQLAILKILPNKPLRSRLVRESRESYPNATGAALTDADGKTAGFYGALFGATPYSFGRAPSWDSFLVERAPAARP